ncbi:MAG: hypothetical protein KGJ66_14975 [Alphaproteobacteria bacterium]|nr:hypothetical protein [Alphaproteobacteria bacterium]
MGGNGPPLPDGNWEIVAASPLAFHEFMHVPREINRGDIERMIEDYARAAVNAEKAGFDMIELPAGHGYLLSGFISPLSNERKDEYGGCLENRMRFSLEVFDVVRPNWPNHRPMSVHISATDWAPGGVTAEEGLQIAAMFRQNGTDVIDVSAGQTSCWANPVYGRMFQTLFSEMIRNEVGYPRSRSATLRPPIRSTRSLRRKGRTCARWRALILSTRISRWRPQQNMPTTSSIGRCSICPERTRRSGSISASRPRCARYGRPHARRATISGAISIWPLSRLCGHAQRG